MHPTYKSVCFALGLLEHDGGWHEALGEASTWATGSQLRKHVLLNANVLRNYRSDGIVGKTLGGPHR